MHKSTDRSIWNDALFRQNADEPEIDEEEEARQNQEMGRDQIRDFLNNFANMQMESLVKSIRITLDYLRCEITWSYMKKYRFPSDLVRKIVTFFM